MRIFFTWLMLLSVLRVKAQENPAGLQVKARQLAWADKPDSSLMLFQYIQDKYPDHEPAYIASQIGDLSFLWKKDSTTAEKNYLFVLTTTTVYVGRNSCLRLAAIYTGKRQYQKALSYLDLAEKEYPHFRICNAGEWERKTRLAYQYAQAFAGLGKHDKAIKQLTHYMFYNPAYFGYTPQDSLEYIRITQFYIDELKKQYSIESLKKQLAAAEETLDYRCNAPASEGHAADVECSMRFCGEKVTLFELDRDDLVPGSRKAFLEGLYASPVYKAIKGL